MVSSNVSMLFSDFMPPKKRDERLGMRMSELVESVSKTQIPAHVTHLLIEIMADDANGEDVEVPFVVVRIR